MSIEEFISKWGKQPDGESGLKKAIAETQAQIESQMLKDIIAEFAQQKTIK